MSNIDSLPPEILFQILHYILTTQNRCPTLLHPLNALASTNKHLYAIVEEYTRSLLKQHANFTPPKSSKKFICRKKFLAQICQFCKRRSERRAILYPTFTCCRLCDKQYFPKLTMTNAIHEHHLSKLDLFTPNALHPHLPALVSSAYKVMGSPAVMILEADVLRRVAHIRGLLGAQADDKGFMQRRTAAHDRIIAHMGIHFNCGKGEWRRAPMLSEAAREKAAKSMRSEEGRREYVRKGLEREWAAMGMGTGSKEGTREDPLVVE